MKYRLEVSLLSIFFCYFLYFKNGFVGVPVSCAHDDVGIRSKNSSLLHSDLMSFGGTVSMPRRCSATLISEIFCESYRSGSRISPFVLDLTSLSQACSLHGLIYCSTHSISELCTFLLQHLINGECMNLRGHVDHQSIACREVAAGFQSSADLIKFIFDMLTSSGVPSVSRENLWTVAQIVCPDLDSVCDFERYCRQKVIDVLHVFRSRGTFELASRSLEPLFSKAEHLPKAELEAIASWHNVCFIGTKDELLDRIISHISKGTCATNFQD